MPTTCRWSRGALGDAGLAAVFDSAAAYTIFTPRDAAFDALGEPGKELREPEQRPALIAILRDHIVPGYLTPEDISNAIDVADDKKVRMRTMGGHTLTFTSEGDEITVTNEDGSSAKFAGNASARQQWRGDSRSTECSRTSPRPPPERAQ
jgi:uncharacterized surface protein with fasciclin (FAS1) repeats